MRGWLGVALWVAAALTGCGGVGNTQDTGTEPFAIPAAGEACDSRELELYCVNGTPLLCDGPQWFDSSCTADELQDTGQLHYCCECPQDYTGTDNIDCSDVGPI